MSINIEGLDKAKLLAALYNGSQPLGMGFAQYTPEPMTVEEARTYIEKGDDLSRMFPNTRQNRSLYFDYLKGRVMKIDLSGDTLDTWGYNRDNGEGAAERIVYALYNDVI